MKKNIWRKIFAKLPFLAARALEELSLLKQKKEIPKRGYISKTAPEVQTTMALLNLNMENHTAENTDTTVVVEITMALLNLNLVETTMAPQRRRAKVYSINYH